MKLFQFILGKVLGGLCAIAAMVLLVGLWELQLLPATMMTLVAIIVTLAVALVVVLTWSREGKLRLLVCIHIAALGIAVIVLLMELWQSQILTTTWMVVADVIVAILTALAVVLKWSNNGKARMIIGSILAVIGIGVMCVGSFYIWKAVSTLNRISSVSTETVQMSVCMRTNDKRSLDDDFKFGVLTEDDRKATDSVIEKLNQDLNTEISYTEYENPTMLLNLLDDLLSGKLDAIILNKACLEMLSDIPGYEETSSQIRDVILQEVVIEIPVEEEPEEKDPDQYASMKGSFAVYISGIDARGGKVSVKSRSDVNIIAVVNPETKQVLLISTPRDYYVPISSPQKYLDGKKDKLTHAGLGGPNASRETLSNLYGIDISYYFKVNFSGFVEIVDALDGITVHSDFNFQSTADDGTVYYYQKGENEMNGHKALAFCRNRKSFADGDNQRGKNQMAVIKAVINKMLSPKLLTNYTQILDAVSGSMEMTVPMEVIGDLVSQQLSEGGAWNVVSYSVTGSGGYAKSPAAGGAEAYMMFPHEASVNRAKELIQGVIDGKTVTP